MGYVHLNPANREQFVARINALKTDSNRLWGKLEPAGLLAHLTIALQGTLEEVKITDESNFFSRHIIRRIAIDSPLPFPKGMIKVPDHFTPAPQGNIDEERTRLIQTMDRFLETSEREPNRKTVQPLFGPLTLKYWQKLHGKHMAHHFEQFGV